jgi:diguanylate cyclase (GGDEF)-like protein
VVGDLDEFKQINDRLGHAHGDAVLKEVAYRLRKQLRAFDLAYRVGGEEFLVLLPGANLQESATIAESLRQAICGERMIGDLRLTMSFGVGASTGDERFDYEAVFAEADNALYAAKAAGRDCVQRAIPVAERAIAL